MSHWVIAGASGVIGRHLRHILHDRGGRTTLLSYGGVSDARGGEQVVRWNPREILDGKEGALKPVRDALESADVVVNLAGSSLADGRLGVAHREWVLGSRLLATQCLVGAYTACQNPPKRWLQASAVGYYGDCGAEKVTEDSPLGSMFLSEVCDLWEDAAEPARQHGASMAVLRFGLVLAPDAPAFQKMLTPIKLGAGGPLGPGTQQWAWLSAQDAARAIVFLAEQNLDGPVNITAPEPCAQLDLTKALAKRLNRPSFLPAPAWGLRLVTGGVADELLLPSCAALPTRLLEAGFQFNHGKLADVVPWLLP